MEEDKYKAALERAKSAIKECGDNVGRIKMIESIFPELKESDDERIRKDIIFFLTRNTLLFGDDINKYESWIAWLEKQGEQKPTDKVEPKFKVGDKVRMKEFESFPHICTVEDVDSDVYYCDFTNFDIDDQDSWELVTEPKFKVGDWLINRTNATIVQIVGTTECYYDYIDQNGQRKMSYISYIEWDFRPWTIQDAKDGDVLAFEPIEGYPSPFIVLYKEQCKTRPECFYSYCFISHLGDFCNGGDICDSKNIHPATKEQRELLFRKMKEAGYVWNPTTKELSHKEVTKKSDKVWNEEDEEMKDLIDEISCHNDDVDYETHVRITRWLNELKRRLS